MSGAPPSPPAVFLDRDGTLIDELGYLSDPAKVRLYPRAAEAVRRLKQAGFATILITNQSGIARGLLDEATLADIHARLLELLGAEDAHLDLVLYCPHHPEVGAPPYRKTCACRKPAPGMFLEAAQRLGIDLSRSWAIGDSLRDLEAAGRAQVRSSILVATGKGRVEHQRNSGCESLFVADLISAAEHILKHATPERADYGK